MKVHGVVRSWQNGIAQVQIPSEACSGCRAGCGAQSPSLPGVVQVPVPEHLSPGERVEVDIPVPSPGRAALLAFGLPLVGLVAGLGMAAALWPGRVWPMLLAALMGAASGFAVVAWWDRRHRCRFTGAAEG